MPKPTNGRASLTSWIACSAGPFRQLDRQAVRTLAQRTHAPGSRASAEGTVTRLRAAPHTPARQGAGRARQAGRLRALLRTAAFRDCARGAEGIGGLSRKFGTV